MAADTEIANMAISHLGSGKTLESLETDRTPEANACRVFYEQARKQTLRDFTWPFATKFVSLALVEENPTDEWLFSYQYPSDCLMIRRILSGSRIDAQDTRVPYKIVRDDDGWLIYTDTAEAQIEYTFDDDEVDRWPADFCMTVSLRLAVYIAPRITAGDPFKLRDSCLKMYFYEGSKATSLARMEEGPDPLPDSEFVRAREE